MSNHLTQLSIVVDSAESFNSLFNLLILLSCFLLLAAYFLAVVFCGCGSTGGITADLIACEFDAATPRNALTRAKSYEVGF